MAKIDDFRANLTGGGARPSQFRCRLSFPNWVLGGAAAAQQGVFLVRAATLPGSNTQSIEVPYRGRFAKIAGERVFQNWNVTVMTDNNFLIRDALENWSSTILNHTQTNGILAPVDYVVDMFVDQLDRNDEVLKTYRFYNVFPVNISEIQLDFGNINTIEEFQCEFSVDYWASEGVTDSVNR